MEPGINLDQLRVFATVVEEGSFSAAARKLHRTQSAVTYAVQKLEIATGTALFDRSNYRPDLTDAGSALLDFDRQFAGKRRLSRVQGCRDADGACHGRSARVRWHSRQRPPPPVSSGRR